MQALPTITLAENQPQNISLPIGVSAIQIHNASTGFLMVDISGSSTYVGPQSWVTIPLGGQTSSMRLTLLDASVGTVYATVFMATDGNLPNTLVSGSLNQQQIAGNVSTMSTDTAVINETITANVGIGDFGYTNLLFDIPTSNPPSHAYLVELYYPGITQNGIIQAQALWWNNTYSPGNYFINSPLIISPQLNISTPNYILSSVIPASLISHTLLLQILTYSPDSEIKPILETSLKLGITGYTAAIPSTNNDIDYNGLTVAQNTSLATNSAGVALTNAYTQYTIFSIPNTSSNNVKVCSIWATGSTTVFTIYTPFDTNGSTLAVLNSATIDLTYLMTPGSYIQAYCTSAGTNAGINYTYI